MFALKSPFVKAANLEDFAVICCKIPVRHQFFRSAYRSYYTTFQSHHTIAQAPPQTRAATNASILVIVFFIVSPLLLKRVTRDSASYGAIISHLPTVENPLWTGERLPHGRGSPLSWGLGVLSNRRLMRLHWLTVRALLGRGLPTASQG